MKYKALLPAVFAALSFTACNVNVKDVKSAAKREYRIEHEYRDSQKWGKVIDKDIETEDFTSLYVSGKVDIVFMQNDTLGVRAYGNEKAIEKYDIAVNDGTLNVRLRNNKMSVFKDTPAITVFVNAPAVESIKSDGEGEISLCDRIEQDCGLDINILGAGDIDAKDLKVARLSVTVNGAGDLTIDECECTGNADITVNGAGEIWADVKCANACLTVNGAGGGTLKARCNELTAACNGTGDIKLKGECNTLNKKDGATSSIDSRKLKINSKVNIVK